MLLRIKTRKKRSSLVWTAAYLLTAAIGIYSLHLAWSGLVSGSIANFSRFNHAFIQVADQPIAFWATFALCVAGGGFMVDLAVYGWYNAST